MRAIDEPYRYEGRQETRSGRLHDSAMHARHARVSVCSLACGAVRARTLYYKLLYWCTVLYDSVISSLANAPSPSLPIPVAQLDSARPCPNPVTNISCNAHTSSDDTRLVALCKEMARAWKEHLQLKQYVT